MLVSIDQRQDGAGAPSAVSGMARQRDLAMLLRGMVWTLQGYGVYDAAIRLWMGTGHLEAR